MSSNNASDTHKNFAANSWDPTGEEAKSPPENAIATQAQEEKCGEGHIFQTHHQIMPLSMHQNESCHAA